MINHVQFPALGITITVNRIAFTIFGIDIYWYGIILTSGILISVLVGFSLAKKLNMDTDRLLDVVLVGGVMSIVCARAYYVAFAPFKYDSFLDIINIRDGGIGVYGSIIGAFVFGGITCLVRKVNILDTADIAGICFLLGQAIGRWGNFVNQEAFGTNTDSVFGMISEGTTRYLLANQSRLASQGIIVNPYKPVHPTFLYESLWCFAGFLLLYFYFKHRKFKGEMFCLYLVWYGLGRFFIEGLRTDSLTAGNSLRVSQVVALASSIAAALVLIYNWWKIKKEDSKVINV